MEQAEVAAQPLITRETATAKAKQTKKSNTSAFILVCAILFLLTAAGLFSEGYSIIQLNKQLNEVKKFIHFKE